MMQSEALQQGFVRRFHPVSIEALKGIAQENICKLTKKTITFYKMFLERLAKI